MVLLEQAPWLAAMAVLIGLSGFFSASEAAFFSLRWPDRKALQSGNRSQRMAAALLQDADRLLTAVLFWNLLVNMTYFALASIIGLRLERQSTVLAGAFSSASLLAIIFFSEMLPKSVAVLSARPLAAWFALPLAAAVRLADPLMPLLRTANLLSQRLIWPGFAPEALLEATDLDRAVTRSHADEQLARAEREALRNVLLLSEIRADEWMRPRTQFRAFQPSVRLADLQGQLTPSGYLLITEPGGDEDDIAAALALEELSEIPDGPLDTRATPVVYAPWCATVADVMQQMQTQRAHVAAVVNEYGETIGILTREDVLDTIFTYSPSRSKLLLDEKPIHDIAPGVWIVAGVTSLRRLSHYLGLELPASKSVTVAGAVQDSLQRLAVEGDQGLWGPFHFQVLEAPQRGHMIIRLELAEEGGEEASP